MTADVVEIGSARRQHADAAEKAASLKSGGGDGTFGDVEARVAKLEAHMEHVRAELAKLSVVPVELATLKTKVDHLPGKGFVVSSAVTTVAAITGLIVLLQRLGILH